MTGFFTKEEMVVVTTCNAVERLDGLFPAREEGEDASVGK